MYFKFFPLLYHENYVNSIEKYNFIYFNENDDEINIIEVKATTSNKYLSLEGGYKSTKNNNCSKYSIFYKDERGIYHLKEDLKNYE